METKRSRSVMRLALTINDLVARDRNEGITDPALHLLAGRIVSRDEALRWSVLPCYECRPTQYRLWAEGHYRPGHTCSTCRPVRKGSGGRHRRSAT